VSKTLFVLLIMGLLLFGCLSQAEKDTPKDFARDDFPSKALKGSKPPSDFNSVISPDATPFEDFPDGLE